MAGRSVADVLTELGRGAPPDAELPQRLAESCAAALPGAGVGLSLTTPAGPAGVLAATRGTGAAVEELQLTLGVGPCRDAWTSGRPALHADLAATGAARWPAFVAGALGAGVQAVFAFPVRVGAVRLGVLDVSRAARGALDTAELATALTYADAAVAVLVHLQAGRGAGDGPPLALRLVEDSAEVHQATGMVSVQAGVGVAQALGLLQARAFAGGRPLREVARDVLRGAVRFTRDDDGIGGG
ncbi:GAF and ANTAR domain-containing protein [Kineococcus rubinsiae]|uniref:GAF and ANTAR domain-containing protein n=1 Tax=Kineococcus rubinsiae TaxID=2609562 RepID=UPI00143227FD|nr:GAF and ANTAR domain-containing protein [Kineococcus rubinsiae]